MTSEDIIAEFVAGIADAAVPDEALALAAEGCLDGVGVMIAGSIEAPARLARRQIERFGSGHGASIIATALRASPGDAALVNGVAGHVLDYDDMGAFGHPTAVLLPALLAVGEAEGATGREILTAYVAGFEVGESLHRGLGISQGETGLHGTAMAGAFAATAAACVLLRLSAEQVRMAMGIAASTPAGLVQNFGTFTKSLHPAMAARNGVMAAYLAADGWTANPRAFEGPGGVMAVYGRSDAGRLRAAVADLTPQPPPLAGEGETKVGNTAPLRGEGEMTTGPGSHRVGRGETTSASRFPRAGERETSAGDFGALEDGDPLVPPSLARGGGQGGEVHTPWAILRELTLKRFPCCGSTHAAINTITGLMQDERLTADDVAWVEVGELPPASHVLLYREPRTGFEGKFSIDYVAARAFADGVVTPDTFREGATADPAYLAVKDKVRVRVGAKWDHGGEAFWPRTDVVMRLNDGRTLRRSVDRYAMPGTRACPLPADAVRAKFFENCKRAGIDPEPAYEAWSRIRDLANIREAVRTLMRDT